MSEVTNEDVAWTLVSSSNIVVPQESWIIEEAVNLSQAAGDLADAAVKLNEGGALTDRALRNAIFTLANRVTLILGGTPTSNQV